MSVESEPLDCEGGNDDEDGVAVSPLVVMGCDEEDMLATASVNVNQGLARECGGEDQWCACCGVGESSDESEIRMDGDGGKPTVEAPAVMMGMSRLRQSKAEQSRAQGGKTRRVVTGDC